jgi:DNA-binding NarL/FixJ family response regulator
VGQSGYDRDDFTSIRDVLNMPLTLLVVEDDPAIALTLSEYFEAVGYGVVHAASAEKGICLLKDYRPHLLIADISLPGMNGYELVKQVRKNPLHRLLPVIFLTARDQTRDRILGYQTGCDVYVAKPFNLEELAAIVRGLLDRVQMMQQTELYAKQQGADAGGDVNRQEDILTPDLTEREEEVLNYLCQGSSNRQIGLQMRLSPRTVEKYVSKLFQKTDTQNRGELIRYALDRKLVTEAIANHH